MLGPFSCILIEPDARPVRRVRSEAAAVDDPVDVDEPPGRRHLEAGRTAFVTGRATTRRCLDVRCRRRRPMARRAGRSGRVGPSR